MRLFIDFQMMGCTSKLKFWIPKNYGPIDYFVTTKKVMLRHSFHLCPPTLVVACSFCRDIFSCFVFEFCHDIIWICHDIVMLKLSNLCLDRSVLYRDIKTLLQHNLSFSAASEFYHDIDFFVAIKLLIFQP